MILLSPAIKIVSNLFIVPAGALKYHYAPGEFLLAHYNSSEDETQISHFHSKSAIISEL